MIIESSSWDTSDTAFKTSAYVQGDMYTKVITALSCTDGDGAAQLKCLREKSWEDVLDLTAAANISQTMAIIDSSASSLFTSPALTMQPIDAITKGDFNQVPVIIGHNEKESRLGTYFQGTAFETAKAVYGATDTPEGKKTLRDALVAYATKSIESTSDVESTVDSLLSFYPITADGDFTMNYDVYTAVRTDSGTGFGTWALAQEIAANGVNVYNYVFRAAPNDLKEWGAMHLTELAFVLDQPDFFPLDETTSITWSANDTATSDLVQRYWVNFADSGNPNVQTPASRERFGARALDAEWPMFLSKPGSTIARTLLFSRTNDGSCEATAADDWRGDALNFYAESRGFKPKVGPGASNGAWPAGAIVALVLGIIVVMVIPAAVVAIVIFVIRRRRQNVSSAGEDNGESAAATVSTSLLGEDDKSDGTSYGVIRASFETERVEAP
jgi:hypothetical protein